MKQLITITAILFSIILVVLAVLCFVFSTVVTTTSLRQPNAQIFDIPIELSKPNVYRTDFHPARYSLGIEFNLKFDELYSANKKIKDLEIQIAVIDKTAGVLFEEIKTRDDFLLNRRKGVSGSFRVVFQHPFDLKGDLLLEFKVVKPAIGLDDKGQHLTANSMRTRVELDLALYVFMVGLVSSVIAVVIIKRLRKTKASAAILK